MRERKKHGGRYDCKAFSLDHWKDELAISRDGEAVRGSSLGGPVRRFTGKMLNVVCLLDIGEGEESAIAYSLT